MILNINDKDQVENPTADDLNHHLPQVGIDEYCILSRKDEEYMQFYHNDDDTYLLEYRDGSFEKHYAETSEQLSIDEVLSAFVGYLEGDEQRWKAKHEWRKVEFDADFAGDDFLTHYELNGKEYHRIRVGREREPVAAADGICLECEAKYGDYHAESCLAEECPRCHGPLQACDCE